MGEALAGFWGRLGIGPAVLEQEELSHTGVCKAALKCVCIYADLARSFTFVFRVLILVNPQIENVRLAR